METLQPTLPRPAMPLAVRRLAPEDAPHIAALYRNAGKDGAWCGTEAAARTVSDAGVWWGGFAENALMLCAALVPCGARVPQAEALCGALWPDCPPAQLLLPPAASPAGAALAAPLLHLLNGQLLPEDGARAAQTNAPPDILAALPVKAPAPLLAAYFAAGWAAVRVRPLLSLRPHYLFLRRAALPSCPAGQAVRRVYLPLTDTLAVSRLLERGFCATALCRSSADERTLLQFERIGGACFARGRPMPRKTPIR